MDTKQYATEQNQWLEDNAVSIDSIVWVPSEQSYANVVKIEDDGISVELRPAQVEVRKLPFTMLSPRDFGPFDLYDFEDRKDLVGEKIIGPGETVELIISSGPGCVHLASGKVIGEEVLLMKYDFADSGTPCGCVLIPVPCPLDFQAPARHPE